MKYWFLTLKYNTHPLEIRVEYYMEALLFILNKFKNVEMYDNAFESDSEGRLHFHVILKAKYIRWKIFTDYYKDSKMHINNIELPTIDDVLKVQQYLKKQRLNPYEHEQKILIKEIEQDQDPFNQQNI